MRSEVIWIFTEPLAVLVIPTSLLRIIGCFLFKEAHFYVDMLQVTSRCAIRGHSYAALFVTLALAAALAAILILPIKAVR